MKLRLKDNERMKVFDLLGNVLNCSVREALSVRRPVRRSVDRWDITIELKTRIYVAAVGIVYVCVGEGLGVRFPAHSDSEMGWLGGRGWSVEVNPGRW